MKALCDKSAFFEIPYPYEMVWRVSARGLQRLDEAVGSIPLFPNKHV